MLSEVHHLSSFLLKFKQSWRRSRCVVQILGSSCYLGIKCINDPRNWPQITWTMLLKDTLRGVADFAFSTFSSLLAALLIFRSFCCFAIFSCSSLSAFWASSFNRRKQFIHTNDILIRWKPNHNCRSSNFRVMFSFERSISFEDSFRRDDSKILGPFFKLCLTEPQNFCKNVAAFKHFLVNR